jgi:hypothetical protein
MGKHWVQALVTLTRYDDSGAFKKYLPGDWFEARNQEVLALRAAAKIADVLEVLGHDFNFKQCGILWRNDAVFRYTDLDRFGVAQEAAAHLSLPWQYTLLALPDARITAQNAALGFLRVEDEGDAWNAWEMAACLQSGLPLAAACGSQKERDKTLAAIGDLRIPLYETGMVWVRRTSATLDLVSAWDAELQHGADEAHAFVRALYTRRIRMCTLAPDWVGASPGVRR